MTKPRCSGLPTTDAPIALIGPSTGLGVSALVPTQTGAVPIPGEGGHVTMAPANARESAVLDLMRKRYDHVSAERVLSGPGLVNLYATLCELSAAPAAPFTPAQITNPRMWDEDPRTLEATAMFCAMLVDSGRQSGSDLRRARRHLHRGRYRAEAGVVLRADRVPDAVRG